MGEDPGMRIGDSERQEAVERLRRHHEAGRLDSFEFEDRRGRALDALTRADLDALFADLPERAAARQRERKPADPKRDAYMGLVVLGAIALFFVTRSWLWFLAIPAAGLVYTLRSGNR